MKRLIVFILYLIPTIFIYPFLLNAEDSNKCFPPCRTGYICHEGNCISLCNPPCPPNQKCTNEGECLEIGSSSNSLTKTSVEPTKSNRVIACDSIFIVRPDITTSIVPGDFEDEELLNVSNLVANAVVSKMGSSSTVISTSELELVRGCQSKLVVCKVKSYSKEPALMEQNEGTVTILIESYNSINDNTPVRIEEFSATGERHWGESIPLENAFNAVSKKIRQNYKQ